MKPQYVLPFERPIVELEEQLAKLESQQGPTPVTLESIRNMRVEIAKLKRDVFENLNPWETVQVARHQDRPQARDYIELICDEFIELHGDRAFGDDRAINAGFAKIDDCKVLFIGQHKGRNLKERNECLYGCAHPEGYRKALLKMQLAAKFNLPIVCLIDTPGAYPGIGAEERGQPPRDVTTPRPHRLYRDWRRGVRGGAGAWDRRLCRHSAVRILLRDQSGRMRRDHVEECRVRQQGRACTQVHRA